MTDERKPKSPIEKTNEQSQMTGAEFVRLLRSIVRTRADAEIQEWIAQAGSGAPLESPAGVAGHTPSAAPSASPPPGFAFSEMPGHVDQRRNALAWDDEAGFVLMGTNARLARGEHWLVPAPSVDGRMRADLHQDILAAKEPPK